MSGLSPCPFCASGRLDQFIGDDEKAAVSCMDCGASSGKRAFKSDAANAWNARPSTDAMHDLRRGYLTLLENARDRIIFLGGECDTLARMIEADTYLRAADAALAAAQPKEINP